MDVPDILRIIRQSIPNARLVIAGTGPVEEELKRELPEALFMGWVEREQLPGLFSSSDILLLPSRFDTFSCVVLEAMSCGLPVVAYNTKGPRDIIEDGVSGFLAGDAAEMADRVIGFLSDPLLQPAMKESASRRAEEYQAGRILDRLLLDTMRRATPVRL